MGLAFNSGPDWEDDSLNQIQIDSIERNAREMIGYYRPYYELSLKRKTNFLPSEEDYSNMEKRG